MDPALGEEILCGVKSLPTLIHEIFEVDEDMKAFAKHYGFKSDAFFLGRAIDYAVAMEGALKLKEISYIHAEAVSYTHLEYSTVYHDKETARTAYSFCMCPGGQVVASASENGGVVVNGMSLYARDSGVANSAIVVNVGPDDFGNHPLDGVAFQREWERKAYELGCLLYTSSSGSL